MKFFKDNIEFLQNELRSKDEIIEILVDGNSSSCSGKSTSEQITTTNRKQHIIL